MTTLDVFSTKINLLNANKGELTKELDRLSKYLKHYEENVASALVKKTAKSLGIKERANLDHSFNKLSSSINQLTNTIKKVFSKKREIIRGKGKAQSKGLPTQTITQAADKVQKKAGKKFSIFDLIKKLSSVGFWMHMIMQALPVLFEIGKLGFELVSNLVKNVITGALEAGKWLYDKIKGLVSDLIPDSVKKLAEKIGSGLKKAGDKVKAGWNKTKDKVKSGWNKAKDKAKAVRDKVSTKLRDSANKFKSKTFKTVGTFFEKAKNKLSSSKIGQYAWNATKGAAAAVANGAKKVGSVASGLVPEWFKKKLANLQDKTKSVINKVKNGLTSSRNPAAKSLKSALPKALSKTLARLVPGLGWTLLAYDIYTAYRKSNSVVSFAVNLVDALSFGMLGLAVGTQANIPDGNLGLWIDNLINGSDSDTSSNGDLAKEVNYDSLDDTTLKLLDTLKNIDVSDVGKTMGTINQIKDPKLRKQLTDSYKQIQQKLQNGEIDANQANAMFRNSIDSISGVATASPMTGDNFEIPEQTQELIEYNQALTEQQIAESAVNNAQLSREMLNQYHNNVSVPLNTVTAASNINYGQYDSDLISY